jgi:hypothetical protein
MLRIPKNQNKPVLQRKITTVPQNKFSAYMKNFSLPRINACNRLRAEKIVHV